MKTYILSILLLLIMTPVHGYMYIGTTYTNLNKVNPAPDGMYYRCVNSVIHSCSMYVQMDYNSITGGVGTEDNPYILSGCSFLGCACWRSQYRSSSTSCASCANNALGTQADSPHTNTTCAYCEKYHLKTVESGVTKCSACPSNGTCNGTTTLVCNKGYYGTSSCSQCPSSSGVAGTTKNTGSTAITSCYIPSGSGFSDGVGSGKYSGDCYYTN